MPFQKFRDASLGTDEVSQMTFSVFHIKMCYDCGSVLCFLLGPRIFNFPFSHRCDHRSRSVRPPPFRDLLYGMKYISRNWVVVLIERHRFVLATCDKNKVEERRARGPNRKKTKQLKLLNPYHIFICKKGLKKFIELLRHFPKDRASRNF